MKHGVMCSENGLVAAHDIIERKGEDHFESFEGGPPGLLFSPEPPFDVEMKCRDNYVFQIAGLTSLHVLEKATCGSLRDVGFLHFREISINGVRTEIARIAMAGGLAYELHGPVEDAPAIYQAVFQAGQLTDGAAQGCPAAIPLIEAGKRREKNTRRQSIRQR